MDCLSCKEKFEKSDDTVLGSLICSKCWGDMGKGDHPNKFIYSMVMVLLLASISFANSWESFVSLSFEEKMILQNEGLKKIANGSTTTPYLTRLEASTWVPLIQITMQEFSVAYPAEYNKAVENVKTYMKNMSVVTPTIFIKVGDIYVSESVCKANPKQCEVAPKPVNVTQTPVKVANKRTPQQCLSARQKDWDAFVYSNYPNVPTEGVNEVEKNALLDHMAEGLQSWQAICLRGE